MKYKSIFFILILFLFNACKKYSTDHPKLHGSWRSATTDITLTLRDGKFEVVHNIPSRPRILVQTGIYKLDGSDLYITAQQVEWIEAVWTVTPEIRKYEKTVPEHFRLRLRNETIELTRGDRGLGVLLIVDGIYIKKN